MSGKKIASDKMKMKFREKGAHTWRSMDIISRYVGQEKIFEMILDRHCGRKCKFDYQNNCNCQIFQHLSFISSV